MAKRIAKDQRLTWRALVFVLFIGAGFLFVASATTARGSDLRPAGGSVVSLLTENTAQLERQQESLAVIDAQIEKLSAAGSSTRVDKYLENIQALSPQAGLTSVTGPGVRVTLSDAPYGLEIPGVDPNALVVHQQDLQSVVNALWAGGAEAITLQGQRIVSTTGIRCVGSTVVLNGVPYTPPYVIEAVGDAKTMQQSLNSTPAVRVFQRYAQRFNMVYKTESVSRVFAPEYSGTASLQYATVLDD